MLGQSCTQLLEIKVLSDTQNAEAEDTGKQELQQNSDEEAGKAGTRRGGAASGGGGGGVGKRHTCYSVLCDNIRGGTVPVARVLCHNHDTTLHYMHCSRK